MKLQKLTFLLSLLGILLLIFLTQTKPIQTATIESIHSTSSKTIIKLQNHSTELIIFDTPLLNIKSGDKIKFQGKASTYKNQKQIIINKISKIK
jgi:DNA/RNA endonuclease YhcR with UshA esterase domain